MRWDPLAFSSINEGRKNNGIREISFMEMEPKISSFGDKQNGQGITGLNSGISQEGSKGKR
jgi:hypothetical protein